MKDDMVVKKRGTNNVVTPPSTTELEVEIKEEPENMEEPPEVYLGTSLVESQLDVDPFFTTLIVNGWLLHN
ncbi:hypothetical protein KI387_027167, partial [Taxus chinensis]